MPPVAPLPYVTAGLGGSGGVIKRRPEDFVVEEIPLYPPCGDGEHLFVLVEKHGLAAGALIQHVAHVLGLKPYEVGCAGLKDTHAVTRQYLSVPAACAASVQALDHDRLRVLSAARHRNKLRTGHLAGNRFTILVRETAADAVPKAEAVVAALRSAGVANFFGPQRFGHDGATLTLGLALLRGGPAPGLQAVHPGRRGFMRRLALCAAQSAVFNETLARRMRDGLLHTLIAGEVAMVVRSGGPFVVDDVAVEQPRFAAHEIVPAGPMFGPKMRRARGEAAAREQQALATLDLSAERFDGFGKILLGTRRAALVWPEDLAVQAVADGLQVTMTLPPGCYATVVLREIMKGDSVKASAEDAADAELDDD
ncbi:MAG: tRNA pseudouridine(13) synthase TruD [Deltaproteobacteria bacterium]|nr:tRNA pseudouridine(13) synthase TruD [Deltaproteobacteria bacterium]